MPSQQPAARKASAISLARVTVGPLPGVADAADREAALAKWDVLLEEVDQAGLARGTSHGWASFDGHSWVVRETLAAKAIGTLYEQAGSLYLYIQWSRSQEHPAFPLEQDTVLAYFRDCNINFPTRATAFLEAVVFLGGMFEADVEAAFSKQSRGVAFQGLAGKKTTVKRREPAADTVGAWEEKVWDCALNHDDRSEKEVVRGFLRFMTHTRVRAGDATKISREPVVEGPPDAGFIETQAAFGCHKTGHAVRAVGHLLPVAGHSDGLNGVPWASAWLDLRVHLELRASKDQ